MRARADIENSFVIFLFVSTNQFCNNYPSFLSANDKVANRMVKRQAHVSLSIHLEKKKKPSKTSNLSTKADVVE